jgi:tRNA threonylcarbamoyladenosine biosynthesis protein TsaE
VQLNKNMEQINIAGIEELPKAATWLIEKFDGKKVIAFYGSMGAGKTTLIKEIAREMGVSKVVTSPTFALVNEYVAETGQVIYHFDLYRINKIEELYDFGYEDYFYSNHYCFVEWPEMAEELLPSDSLKVKIEDTGNNTRNIKVFD